MQQAMYVDKNGTFCGYRELLLEILPQIQQVLLYLPQAKFSY